MEPVDLSRCEITDLANILNDAFNPEFEADNPEPRLALPLLPFRLGSTDELVLSDLLAEGAALRSISRREVSPLVAAAQGNLKVLVYSIKFSRKLSLEDIIGARI